MQSLVQRVLSPHRFVKSQNHRQSEERTHFGSINRGIIVGTEEVLYQYVHQLASERIRALGFEIHIAYNRFYVLLGAQPEKLRKFSPRVRPMKCDNFCPCNTELHTFKRYLDAFPERTSSLYKRCQRCRRILRVQQTI